MVPRGVFLLAAALQVAADSSSCCQALKRKLPAQVFNDHDATYAQLNNQRWSNTSILAPSCVFEPKSALDVSKGVQVLVERSCPFSIKSGGHNPIPGANNIDGGVSMVLGLLNKIDLTPDRSFVGLGPGAKWGQVYSKLAGGDNVSGLLVPGGLCGGTGVGGVSTGGGESYLLASHGWVVDNVINYQVVLASGQIVNANQKSNSDLYRALKGGGNNFGIVTRADVAVFEQPQLWGGSILLPYFPDSAVATLYAITNFTAGNNIYPNNGAQVVITYTSTGTALIALSVASTDGTVNSTGLTPFTSLQPQIANTVGLRSISDIVAELDGNQGDGFRDTSATITFANDPATLFAVHNASDHIYLKYNATVPYLDWVMFYVPTAKIDGTHAEARGGNVLGLDDEEKDLIVAFITPRWLDPAYDHIMYEMTAAWVDAVKSVTVKMGTDHPFLYQNFAAATQKPLCGYGAKNVQFMQSVSKKYDPKSVFQKLVPGKHFIFYIRL
ncbi:6-hydroxy-D-nicotine oxidase [Dothidotthia symphoricarpi CBS 119687]|uniref:6-hydroxy-D-nicotine oxidase n=1 Tax=Dothidotthia symphoricarpi CBS 119687 TaxID=1392245 RepID=A0A6A6ANR8_9PLEO|nr:6-hydroxy-D-nicotine oxidase [Dothidotthia symphoricarpi CBS 119687]KAF2133642.1 6-hydroxy-D-nicotine oxidase [Dothidotthia symphoricarpi CBS 119687]